MRSVIDSSFMISCIGIEDCHLETVNCRVWKLCWLKFEILRVVKMFIVTWIMTSHPKRPTSWHLLKVVVIINTYQLHEPGAPYRKCVWQVSLSFCRTILWGMPCRLRVSIRSLYGLTFPLYYCCYVSLYHPGLIRVNCAMLRLFVFKCESDSNTCSHCRWCVVNETNKLSIFLAEMIKSRSWSIKS
jgi:hypothetical protein